jgi:Predicted nucleotide-binding protein containing TIR-like domain
MKIAVIGSWKPEDASKWKLTNEGLFAKACREIGNAVIRLGHTLVAGSESTRTADYHAVEGAVQAWGGQPSPRPRIVMVRPNDQRVPFEKLKAENPGLFTSRVSIDSNWNATKLFQVNECDGVVIVGGADLSYQAGLASAVCRRRLIPVGSFGGAAKRLLDLLAISRALWPDGLPNPDDIGLLQGSWNQFLLNKTTDLLGLSRLPTILIIHGRGDDRLLLKNHLQNVLHLPEPRIMAEQFKSGAVLPEKFEQIADACDGAIALATADDLGALASEVGPSTDWERRARQNVWLEVGWFWGRLGRRRLLLLCRKDVKPPSDLEGAEYFTYTSDPAEKSEELRKFTDEIRGNLEPGRLGT